MEEAKEKKPAKNQNPQTICKAIEALWAIHSVYKVLWGYSLYKALTELGVTGAAKKP